MLPIGFGRVREWKWHPTVSLTRENSRRPLPLWWSLKMRKWVISHKIWVLSKWLLFLTSVQLFGSHGGDPHFFESQMLWVQVSKVRLPSVGYEHFTPQMCKAPSSWIPSLSWVAAKGGRGGDYDKTGSLPLILAQYGFFSPLPDVNEAAAQLVCRSFFRENCCIDLVYLGKEVSSGASWAAILNCMTQQKALDFSYTFNEPLENVIVITEREWDSKKQMPLLLWK